MRLLLVAALVLAIAATVAPPVGAATVKPLPLPAGARYAGSDGVDRMGYVFGSYGARQLGLRDLGTGRVETIDIPQQDCASIVATPGGLAASCGRAGSGTSFDLFIRGYDDTGWEQVALTFPPGDGMEAAWITGVGRRWLAVAWGDYHVTASLLLHRAGGTLTDARPAVGERWVPSLDAVDPQRPLCTPLRRAAQPSDLGGEVQSPWAAIAYAKPWAIDGPVVSQDGPTDFVLRHCGGSVSPRTLCHYEAGGDWAAAGCGNVDLTARRAAWTKGPVGYVRDLRTGATTTVRVGGKIVVLHLVGSHVVVEASPTPGLAGALGVLRR